MYIKNTTDTSTQRTIISFLFFLQQIIYQVPARTYQPSKIGGGESCYFLFYLVFVRPLGGGGVWWRGDLYASKRCMSGMTKTGVIFCSFCFFWAFCAKGNNWGLGIGDCSNGLDEIRNESMDGWCYF
jgi:hypothetical protein